jgi:hypothetical protein
MVSSPAPASRSGGRGGGGARWRVRVTSDERDDPDRHVDQEDPAPAGDAEDRVLAGEEAADDRAQDRGRAEDGEEVALVLGALSGRNDVADDREGEGEQATGPEALDRAEEGELLHRVGERAQHAEPTMKIVMAATKNFLRP